MKNEKIAVEPNYTSVNLQGVGSKLKSFTKYNGILTP
jgi:hypothetical protein